MKVLKIEKAPYLGRIYDVDIPNDIILVRKKGCGREALGHMSERLYRSATKAVGSVSSNLKTVNIYEYGDNGTYVCNITVWGQADATDGGVSFGFMSPDSNGFVANVINITNGGVLQIKCRI